MQDKKSIEISEINYIQTVWSAFPMSQIVAADHKPIIKKRTNKFVRIQSDRFKRVSSSWRLTRGIDSRFRRKARGTPTHPSIGFGSDNATKYMLEDGFIPVIVRNVADLEPLRTQNTTHCAVIAAQTGGKLRREIEQKASEMNIKVQNLGARAKKVEAE